MLVAFALLVHQAKAEQQIPEHETLLISVADEGHIVAWYKNYITKAYTELGYRIVYKPLPPGRGHVEAQKGYVDALAIRVSAIENSFPDFIRVPVLLAKGQLMLYCQTDLTCNKDILQDHKNVIGIVSGSNITSQFMKNKVASVYEVRDGLKLAEMFNKQRLNYILTIDSHEFGNYASIDVNKYTSVALAPIEAYHYLHKKHRHLLADVETALIKALNDIGPIPMQSLKPNNR